MKNNLREIRSPKILFVDDNEDHLLLMKEKIKKCGKNFKLFVEQKGEKIFKRVEKIPFDLILLDYDLKGELDGLQILSLLRSKGVECPIVLLTGQGNEQIASQAIKLGAQEYFCKNSKEIDTLLGLIENFVFH